MFFLHLRGAVYLFLFIFHTLEGGQRKYGNFHSFFNPSLSVTDSVVITEYTNPHIFLAKATENIGNFWMLDCQERGCELKCLTDNCWSYANLSTLLFIIFIPFQLKFATLKRKFRNKSDQLHPTIKGKGSIIIQSDYNYDYKYWD